MTQEVFLIHDKEAVLKHFDDNGDVPITLLVPETGSWCETFTTKEQYLKRLDPWSVFSWDWRGIKSSANEVYYNKSTSKYEIISNITQDPVERKNYINVNRG